MRRRELIALAASAAFGGTKDSGWVKSEKNPMLRLGKEGEFDSQNIMSPSIVKEGGQYYLFYAGGPSGPRNGGELVRYQLGLALSKDGETFKKTGRPLLPLGDRDNFHVTPALLRNPAGNLLKKDGKWQMVYCGNREDDIEYATSPDGLRWTKESASPIYRKAYAPNLIALDGEIRMYYIHKPVSAAGAPRIPWEVHLATGPDLRSLRPHPRNPMIKVSQDWETGALFYPYVIQEQNRWVLVYASYWNKPGGAKGTMYTAIGTAESADGLKWTKNTANPILTPIDGSPYESVYNSSQSVIRDGDHYKMYYASRIDPIHKYFAICLATRKGGKLA
jgi:sucrose-6-phosphate hydrolase SacC (GH32 family)